MALFRDLNVVCPECLEVRTERVDYNKNEVKTSYHYKENQHQVVHYLICPDCRERQEKQKENEFVQKVVSQHHFCPKEAIEELARKVYRLEKMLKNHLNDHPVSPRDMVF